eukprot:CAMPEP_0185509916 /NCGR_PEP_ID=MMETSP1366-20130426/48028_1 /TAXON_ID=38817 /ORGANISM="Gephyrocapsa oceanica, Strain RCC1303" /LENGTH=155 /DNA_ID=CAMNT_0028120387 /DNA_START=14 /DNA_END=479 /DNA_ORIENTATION=-
MAWPPASRHRANATRCSVIVIATCSGAARPSSPRASHVTRASPTSKRSRQALQRCLEAQCGNRSASDRRTCGVLLKLFPAHLGRNVSSTVLHMQGACTVVLERNSVGRVCSLQAALRGGDWQTKPVDDKGSVHSTNCSTAYLNKTALWRGQVRAH